MLACGRGEDMISVLEALQIVLPQARPLPPETVPLDSSSLGLVLAEDVASDLDMPPFAKALMDGYAVRAADLATGQAVLAVVEEVPAGHTPRRPVGTGQAARIMTGAPIPPGADAVVMIEHSKLLDEGRVLLEETPSPPAGQNVLPRGREMRRGDIVLRAGSVLRPQEFGLLAAVGRTAVQVRPAPRVAILPTGDEIVEPAQAPGPGQIRNSNGPMLLAQTCRAGGQPRLLGIARDHRASLRALIGEGLQADILVLSGGVSAGKHDLVPGVLEELGVRVLFHKIQIKPGKPLLFGIHDKNDAPTLVFGLPGNPVSSLVCFELFIRPAIRRLKGLSDPGPLLVPARLTEDYPYRTDRPTYHPARLFLGGAAKEGSAWCVQPVPWFGSPDLRGLLAANAFVLLPAGDHHHQAGQVFSVLKVED